MGDHDSHSSRKNRNKNTFRGKIMKGLPLLCLGRMRRTSRMDRETDAFNRQRDQSQADRTGENSITLQNTGSILQQLNKNRK